MNVRRGKAPFVEAANRAQQFYLSFQSVGTLSSVFGWCLGINMWNVMQQGGGNFLKEDGRWNTEGAGPNEHAVLAP